VVGRLEWAKGTHLLAAVIPAVLTRQAAHFTLIGADRPYGPDGSMRRWLAGQLAAAGCRAAVTMRGVVEAAALAAAYQTADLVLVPSVVYESFSYTVADAMAHGVPVIASRIGGIPETLDDGVSGLLVTPGSVLELVAAIGRLAGDPALRRRMGQAGRAKVERVFAPERIAPQMLAVYDHAIAAARRA
jgi:glycosyltransferase involved in cell wall biosynthesis